MKRRIAALLALVMILSAGLALAEGWTCTECGTENSGKFCSECGAPKPSDHWICAVCGTENDGKFCSECGTKRGEGAVDPEPEAPTAPPTDSPTAPPAPTGEMTDILFTMLENGALQVTWVDPAGSGPYTVVYTSDDWNSYEYYLKEADEYTTCMAKLAYLVPGLNYQFYISNGQTETKAEYTVPKPLFSEYTLTKPLTMNKYSFTVSESSPSAAFKVNVYYPQLSHNRNYFGKLAVRSPLGYAPFVYYYEELTFQNRYDYIYCNVELGDFLESVKRAYGSIPGGTYTLELYTDGKLYGSLDFTVNVKN